MHNSISSLTLTLTHTCTPRPNHYPDHIWFHCVHWATGSANPRSSNRLWPRLPSIHYRWELSTASCVLGNASISSIVLFCPRVWRWGMITWRRIILEETHSIGRLHWERLGWRIIQIRELKTHGCCLCHSYSEWCSFLILHNSMVQIESMQLSSPKLHGRSNNPNLDQTTIVLGNDGIRCFWDQVTSFCFLLFQCSTTIQWCQTDIP